MVSIRLMLTFYFNILQAISEQAHIIGWGKRNPQGKPVSTDENKYKLIYNLVNGNQRIRGNLVYIYISYIYQPTCREKDKSNSVSSILLEGIRISFDRSTRFELCKRKNNKNGCTVYKIYFLPSIWSKLISVPYDSNVM